MEYYIHSLLSFSRVKDEVFQIDVEQAKLIILNVINLFETVSITNNSEKVLKLNQLLEKTKPEIKISTAEIACQTDFDENVPETTPLLFYDTNIKDNFNQFINEMCIVRNDVEASSKDIEGLYRLWNKEKPKKETFHAFKHYLDTRFKPCRLEKQDKNHVVYGYKGVSLKEIEYKKKVVQSDAQTFIFQVCKFSPSGTILNTTLTEEFQKWKKSVGQEINGNELNEIKQSWIQTHCDCPIEEEQNNSDIYSNVQNVSTKEIPGYFYYDGTAPAQLLVPTPDPKIGLNEKIDWVDYSSNGSMKYNPTTNKVSNDNKNYYNYKQNNPEMNFKKLLDKSDKLVNRNTYTSNL
jgi:membrane-associated HD superfamily phosphohydrolase